MTVLADAPDIRGLTDDDLAAMFAAADDQARDAIVAELGRRDGLEKARRQRDAQRDEWESGAYAQYLDAERECKGVLVRGPFHDFKDDPVHPAAGRCAEPGCGRQALHPKHNGVDAFVLWSGSEPFAMANATPELQRYWEDHGRITAGAYREQIAAGRRIQQDERDRAKYAAGPEDKMIGSVVHGAVRTAEFAARQQQARQRVDARTAEIRQASGVVATREAAALVRKREPVDGAAALRDARTFFRHFALWPSEAALNFATVFAAATWARDSNGESVFEYLAKLLFTADEYGAGKSWFAALTASLCPAGRKLIEPTKAALVDLVADQRTVVVGELDELFSSPGRNRGIIAVLNGSYERGNYAARKHAGKVEEIHLFGWQILDGVRKGLFGNTRPEMRGLLSRCVCVVVKMAPGDYRRPRWDAAARAIAERGRDKLGAWMAQEVADGIAEYIPDMPEGLGSARRCALWEPFFTVAQRADLSAAALREDGENDHYWGSAITDAAFELEATLSGGDDDDKATELDDILATWAEED